LGVAALSAGLYCATAQAAGEVSGSISITGFFDSDYLTSENSIISGLGWVVSEDGLGLAGAGSGDYVGSQGDVLARAINLEAPSDPLMWPKWVIPDGTEIAVGVSKIVRKPMTCSANACFDGLELVLYGTVSKPGFDETPFVGIWTGQGSCPGADGVCSESWNRTASWSLSITSPGEPAGSDTTPPLIQSNVTGTVGGGGWYVSDADVTWSVTDAESAVTASAGCDPTSITTDTAGSTLTCSATSAGGTSSQSVTIKRDSTAPSASAMAVPAANSYGWRNQNVTVTFGGTDALSGGVTCDPAVVLSSEGIGQYGSGRCYDAAGNQSSLVTAGGIKIDKTKPTITITSPTDGATYKPKEQVTAIYSCTDALAGVATCSGNVVSGQPIRLSKKDGEGYFTVNATDEAGNTAEQRVTYYVK
jgi:hypothetical protein